MAAGGTSGLMPSARRHAARSSTHCVGVQWSFSEIRFAVPECVTKGLAQIPGHDAGGEQQSSGDPLVVAHDGG